MKLFTDLVYEWLEEKRYDVATSTHSKYLQLISKHIEPYFYNDWCNEITDKRIKSFRVHLLENINDNLISNNTGRTIMMIINNACEYGYNNRVLNESIYVKPGLAKNKPRVEVFSKPEQKKLENYIENNNSLHNSAILLALYSGLRIGELCALTWRDFDLKHGAIVIDKSVQRQTVSDDKSKTKLVISSPKTNSSIRTVPVPTFIFQHFKNLYPKDVDNLYLFSNKSEKPLDPRTLQYSYKKVLEDCNIPYKNFHCLRHTFATRCITTGCDIKTLSEILGHADIKITMEYYFHSSFEFKKKQINKLKALS